MHNSISIGITLIFLLVLCGVVCGEWGGDFSQVLNFGDLCGGVCDCAGGGHFLRYKYLESASSFKKFGCFNGHNLGSN